MELKAKEIVDIINACGKNGVSQLKIGDIDVRFNGFVIQKESDYSKVVDGVDKIVQSDPNFQAQQDVEEGIEDDEELMILAPADYEEKLLKGYLEDSDSNMEEPIN